MYALQYNVRTKVYNVHTTVYNVRTTVLYNMHVSKAGLLNFVFTKNQLYFCLISDLIKEFKL